jgi:hypothetical protein
VSSVIDRALTFYGLAKNGKIVASALQHAQARAAYLSRRRLVRVGELEAALLAAFVILTVAVVVAVCAVAIWIDAREAERG